MSAWALARKGCNVTLLERGKLMGETSSASTKLLHGGLRYLENYEFSLVRESLRERAWWIQQAPHLAKPIRLLLPLYKGISRPRLLIRVGLGLYDFLSGDANFGRHSWLSKADLQQQAPSLQTKNLKGAFAFYDAQMDDYALGMWAANQAKEAGVTILEDALVTRITQDGTLTLGDQNHSYDRILNVAGPWCKALLNESGIPSKSRLDLVRGSHLLVDRQIDQGFFLQVPHEKRIGFVLPYKGQTMIGTTEVRQDADDAITCSKHEELYLRELYNHYFEEALSDDDSIQSFAGLRPLVDDGSGDPGKTTREFVFEQQGRILSVFGGKWTTARVLGEKACRLLLDASI
jgi:glycerol-3-phosphate dehydrogenase